MHETSFALLTAVLAASAKFFHGPEVVRSLLDHAQTLINRAVAEGHCDIGMVQCLMVLSHFKATRDRTAWIKIGMALRFAYQLGLHAPPKDTYPTEELKRRAQLVRLVRVVNADCRMWREHGSVSLLECTGADGQV